MCIQRWWCCICRGSAHCGGGAGERTRAACFRGTLCAQVGGQLEPELDDLYGDLKDSTDGDLVPALAGRPAGGQGAPCVCLSSGGDLPACDTRAQGHQHTTGDWSCTHTPMPAGVAAKPPKQAPRPVQDAATLVSTSAPFSPPAGKAQPLLGTEAQYVGLTVAGAGQAQGAKLHTADSHPLPPSPSGQGSGSTGTPTLSLTPTPSPPLSPAPLAAATGAAAPGPQHQSVAGSAASRPPKVPRDQVAPLEAAYDLLPADPPHQRLVAQLAVPSPDPDEERQAVAAGASLLLARAEAAAAALAGAGPPSEVDKYKAALLMAVKEKHVRRFWGGFGFGWGGKRGATKGSRCRRARLTRVPAQTPRRGLARRCGGSWPRRARRPPRPPRKPPARRPQQPPTRRPPPSGRRTPRRRWPKCVLSWRACIRTPR